MKPFITDALKDGRYILHYQTEGIDVADLKKKIKGLNVIAFSMPKSQSLACVWELRVYFSDRSAIDFSSAFTGVGGWNEIGSLNIKFYDELSMPDGLDSDLYVKTKVNDFYISDVEFLIFRAEDVYSECGIIFIDSLKEEIIVMSGVSPGSVTMLTPFDKISFSPEFSYKDYQRLTYDQLISYD